MPRGYRCILIALVGIALTGASPPNHPDQNSAAETGYAQALPPTYKPDPNRNQESCYQNPDHEAADLCAQWTAADAAKETAKLSYWGNWISAGAGVLSFISIILVLLALKQGREANEIARKDSARAESEALATRKHIIHTERAILKVRRMSANAVADGDAFIGFHLHLTNEGKSNAWNIQVAHQTRFSRVFPARFVVSPPLPLTALAERDCTTPVIRLRKPKSFPAFVSGYVSYTTAHDATFKSFFIYRFDGLPLRENSYGSITNQPIDVAHQAELPSNT